MPPLLHHHATAASASATYVSAFSSIYPHVKTSPTGKGSFPASPEKCDEPLNLSLKSSSVAASPKTSIWSPASALEQEKKASLSSPTRPPSPMDSSDCDDSPTHNYLADNHNAPRYNPVLDPLSLHLGLRHYADFMDNLQALATYNKEGREAQPTATPTQEEG
ncbi:unnamed protein product, partial [Meganyctiphanes norvegica]